MDRLLKEIENLKGVRKLRESTEPSARSTQPVKSGVPSAF
jgi:hypothetical protein